MTYATSDYDMTLLELERISAMELYEQCLSEKTTSHLEAFIEHQLAQELVNLPLLYDLSNDLQQRLLALKQYQFDVRKRVVHALSSIYETDITHLTPANDLNSYHLVKPQDVVQSVRLQTHCDISEQESEILQNMVQSSTTICSQLFQDIKLTTRLVTILDDWLMAYSLTTIRQHKHWMGDDITPDLIQ